MTMTLRQIPAAAEELATFKQAMRHLIGGVSVITAGSGEIRTGLTATSAISLSAIGATHIETRVDEDGKPYKCTADDAAYGTFELEGGIIAQMNSSWAVRVDRGELIEEHAKRIGKQVMRDNALALFPQLKKRLWKEKGADGTNP